MLQRDEVEGKETLSLNFNEKMKLFDIKTSSCMYILKIAVSLLLAILYLTQYHN